MFQTDRKLARAEKEKYSLEEKDALGQLCKKCKKEYDAKVKSSRNR